MNTVFFVLLAIAMVMTLCVLFAGILTMVRGGEFNRKYGNKLMRLRVILQGVAIVIFLLAMLLRQS